MNQAHAQSIAAIVNTAGGRNKAIIVPEECETCHQWFFSQTQDKALRGTLGSRVLCPICRVEEDKKSKRDRSASHYRLATFLADPNMIPNGIINRDEIDRLIVEKADLTPGEKEGAQKWELWRRIINGLLPDEKKNVKCIGDRQIIYREQRTYEFQDR